MKTLGMHPAAKETALLRQLGWICQVLKSANSKYHFSKVGLFDKCFLSVFAPPNEEVLYVIVFRLLHTSSPLTDEYARFDG